MDPYKQKSGAGPTFRGRNIHPEKAEWILACRTAKRKQGLLVGDEHRWVADRDVMAHVEQMKGKLLLVHGLIDENVHFRHTARLINGLIAAGKRYDLLLFPDERHMPRKADGRFYMEEQIVDYFKKHLI